MGYGRILCWVKCADMTAIALWNALPYVSQPVTWSWNQGFPSFWIAHWGLQNWPPITGPQHPWLTCVRGHERSCLWIQGWHSRGHNSSHCQCSHTLRHLLILLGMVKSACQKLKADVLNVATAVEFRVCKIMYSYNKCVLSYSDQLNFLNPLLL